MVSYHGRRSAVITLLLACVLVALGGSARDAAAASAPTAVGVAQLHAWVTSEAQRLSGRQVTVTCASDPASWASTLAAAGLVASQGSEVYGFSLIAAGGMYLSPYVCDGLRLGANPVTRAANPLQVGWSVDVLLHESVHLGRFTSDEATVEACARAELPVELHRIYSLAYHASELSALTLAANSFRSTQSASYKGGTCRPTS